jgi:hypothetical protein
VFGKPFLKEVPSLPRKIFLQGREFFLKRGGKLFSKSFSQIKRGD